MPGKLSQLLDFAASIARLPVARLHFEAALNPGHVEKVYKYYTRRHPRYKVIPNKSLGAALVDLGSYRNRDDYMSSVEGRNGALHHAKKARSKGYRLVEIDRNDYVDQIHAVNNSVEVRQGQAMSSAYQEKVEHYQAERNFKYYGALDAAGKLMAYSELGFYGNFASFNRVIGVRNNHGIMHLMVTEIICQLIEDRSYSYLMYDTYFGASPGMKSFKTMLGFQPYRAKFSIR